MLIRKYFDTSFSVELHAYFKLNNKSCRKYFQDILPISHMMDSKSNGFEQLLRQQN